MMQDLTGQTFYRCCATLQLFVNAHAVVLITLTDYCK